MADEEEAQAQKLSIQTGEVKLKVTAKSRREIEKLLDAVALHAKVIPSSTFQRDDRDGGIHQFVVVIGGILDE